MQIERNKEGVPCWDGNAATFQEYAEMASHWEQSVPIHKRYLCGPKLQAELTGTARRFVMSMKPGWISFDGGVQTLLDHLRKHLGQPQLTEMSEYMSKYFKMTKRRRQEGMNDYITRKAEIYARACQTLDRVQRRFSPGVGQRLTGSATRSDYSSIHAEQPPRSRPTMMSLMRSKRPQPLQRTGRVGAIPGGNLREIGIIKNGKGKLTAGTLPHTGHPIAMTTHGNLKLLTCCRHSYKAGSCFRMQD